MASLFSTAILAFCAGTAAGQHNEACNKAIDAGTRQAGFRQSADTAEDRTLQFVNTKIENSTPKPFQQALGAAGFIYKTTRDKRLQFRIPTMGLASSVMNEITPTSYSVLLTWSFP